MQLTWRASQSASCFHAAVAMMDGHTLVDRQLASALAGPRARLCEEIEHVGLPAEPIMREMYALSAVGIESNRVLVERALTRKVGLARTSEGMLLRATGISSRLTGRVRDLEAAYRNFHAASPGPPVVEELELRSQPLRQQWQAYGPGLLYQIGRLTEPELLADSAEVVLVLPAIGGHGVAHLGNNRVTFEAVLANPVPQLPEVVRLAWLLAQIQIDLPRYSEGLARERLDWLAMHALLPPALTAAREVELVSQEAHTQLHALTAWHVGSSASQASRGETLAQWWQAYEHNPPAWHVALAALNELLPPPESAVDARQLETDDLA